MNELQSSSTATADASAELAREIGLVFSTFARLWPLRWAKIHGDTKAMEVWKRAFELARLSPRDVRNGLRIASSAGLDFPPESGEFIRLCRGDVPSDRQSLDQAMRWARGEQVEWSHPAIRAAARDVGSFQLRNMPERDIQRVWSSSYRQMLDRHNRGEDLSEPTVRLIESSPTPLYPELDERIRADMGTPPEVVIERLRQQLGVS